MSSVADGDEQDAATAVAVVTLYGTGAICLLPLAAATLGLDPVVAGIWAVASVHEVAQVIATASPYGEAALLAAVVVKLVRVLMLAPLVIAVGVVARRSSGDPRGGRRALVPWFIVAFVAAVAVRATGSVPPTVLTLTESVSQVLLAAALVSMGTGVRIGRLARSGGPALFLGLLATVLAVALGLPVALLSGA